MIPFSSGMPPIVGHRLPQAVVYGLPLYSIEAKKVQTVPVAVPSQGATARPLLPSLTQKGNPMVLGGHHLSRVLPGPRFSKGRPPAKNVSGENPSRCGIVESGCDGHGECKDVEGKSW